MISDNVASNLAGGVYADQCTIHIAKSTFLGNFGNAVESLNGLVTVDRCSFLRNGTGVMADSLGVTVTNSFFMRGTYGATLQGTIDAFEFNTVVDNSM
ncbi:MAG: hypothetical protein JWO36_5565, partial [Myxococcales bacterium]|nr:hypothetical protein [Myxococcales bacterium]